MVLAPLEPCVRKGPAPPANQHDPGHLARWRSPVSRPGLLFQKSSHRRTHYVVSEATRDRISLACSIGAGAEGSQSGFEKSYIEIRDDPARPV
jgi:hypothetical protein